VRHIHHDWLDAADRTQQTVRLLSEQLRRFLDDKVWLENRRVMDLLRSIERSALAVRHEPRPAVEMALDATAPRVRLPMERPLYAVSPASEIVTRPAEGEDVDMDTSGLFEQVHVDTARLAANVRSLLRGTDQVSLDDVLTLHPPWSATNSSRCSTRRSSSPSRARRPCSRSSRSAAGRAGPTSGAWTPRCDRAVGHRALTGTSGRDAQTRTAWTRVTKHWRAAAILSAGRPGSGG
jgi:hypothetical protein